MDQDPMFQVLLYLKNSYNTVDIGHLLTKLEGYIAGPHMCRLLEVFWEKQDIVTCQNRYHSRTSEKPGGELRVDSYRLSCLIL